MKEEWRNIKGFDRLYQISSFGRCKSFVLSPKNRTRNGYILKEYKKMGYNAYSIGTKKMYAHSLVLEAFIGPRPKGYECAHLDGSKTNNKLLNLKWVTCRENNFHKKLHGTNYEGEKHFHCKYSDKEVLQWNKKYILLKNKAAVARHFNVSRWAVYAALGGKSRKYLNIQRRNHGHL